MDALIRRAETCRARRRSGWLPFLLSLGVHAAFVPFILLTPPPASETGPPILDTNVCRDEPRLSVAFLVVAGGQEASESGAQAPAPSLPQPERTSDPPAAMIPSVIAVPMPLPVPPRDEGRATVPRAGEAGGNQAGAGSAGAPALPALLRLPREVQSVVYVLDRSTSMGLSGAWDVARQWVLASMEGLPSSTRFQVIYYDRCPQLLCGQGRPELVPATPAFLRQAAEQLEALHAGGGTKHLPALSAAVELDPDVVFLLTDGEEMTGEEVRLFTRRNRRAVLNVLELTTTIQDHDGGPLQALATANRGVCQVVNFALQAPTH